MPAYHWTDDSALYQVKNGEHPSDRTESAFRYLEHNAGRLGPDLLDAIRELRAECAGPRIEIRTRPARSDQELARARAVLEYPDDAMADYEPDPDDQP